MDELNLIKNKNEKIKEILNKINITNDKEKKLSFYKDILNIDNTNRDILSQYLLLVKDIRNLTDDNPNPVVEIMTYIHHFPPEQFNQDFAGYAEKKNSSMEKLLLVLKKILSKDWIEATFEEKKDTFNFFLKAFKEDKFEIKNTSPITWKNDELYIFNLYIRLLFQIKRKIKYYESINDIEIKSEQLIELEKKIKNIKDELKNKHSELFLKETK